MTVRDAPADVTDACGGRTVDGGPSHFPSSVSWPALLPSHREVAAAHLLPYTAGTTEHAWQQGETMRALAEADGPVGAATGTLLAYALANRYPYERRAAVDALLAFSARGAFPATGAGAALGRSRRARPHQARPRGRRTRRGSRRGHARRRLDDRRRRAPRPAARTRRASGDRPEDLLALGARTAETVRARDTVPGLADVAARGGSSRTVKEAALLVRVLSGT